MYFRVVADIDECIGEAADSEPVYEAADEKRRIANLMAESVRGFDVEAAIATMTSTLSTLEVTRCAQRRVISVDGQQKCELTGEHYNGRYFVYLISHSVISKTDSHVGFSTNPLVDVYCHNQKLLIDRNTCMAAPNWGIDVVLGPFTSKEAALACGRAWVSRTRGKEPKRKKAGFLASIFNVDMYSYVEVSERSLETRLAEWAPSGFLQLYCEMRACAS